MVREEQVVMEGQGSDEGRRVVVFGSGSGRGGGCGDVRAKSDGKIEGKKTKVKWVN